MDQCAIWLRGDVGRPRPVADDLLSSPGSFGADDRRFVPVVPPLRFEDYDRFIYALTGANSSASNCARLEGVVRIPWPSGFFFVGVDLDPLSEPGF
jgi:hypothetical protein